MLASSILKSVILLLLVSSTNSILSQVNEFYATYDIRSVIPKDFKRDFLLAPDGFIYATMPLSDTNQVHSGRMSLLKLDLSGNIIWYKLIPFCRNGAGITLDHDNNILFVSTDTSLYATIAKFDANGNLIWAKCNTTTVSYGQTVISTADHYYVFGSKVGSPSWEYDYFVTKLDYDGNIIWSNIYETTKADKMVDAVITDDNHLVFIGNYKNELDPIHFYNPIKLDLDGNIIWSRQISFSVTTEALDLDLRSDGIFGVTGRYNGPNWKIFYSSFDQNGNELNRSLISRSAYQEGYSIQGIDDGGWMLCTEPETYNNLSYSQTVMIRINDYGIPIRSILYDISPIGSFPFGARKISDGYLVMGIKNDDNLLYLMKTDTGGFVYCDEKIVGIEHEEQQEYTSNINVYILGTFPFVDTTFDVIDVYYSTNLICFKEDTNESIPHYLPEVPNIFTPNGDGINDFFDISYPYEQDYSLKIINRWGELIFESSSPSISWDGKQQGNQKDAVAGVYFYKLNVGNLSKHGTVTLVR